MTKKVTFEFNIQTFTAKEGYDTYLTVKDGKAKIDPADPVMVALAKKYGGKLAAPESEPQPAKAAKTKKGDSA